jgi:hypothetical protein
MADGQQANGVGFCRRLEVSHCLHPACLGASRPKRFSREFLQNREGLVQKVDIGQKQLLK